LGEQEGPWDWVYDAEEDGPPLIDGRLESRADGVIKESLVVNI
jgi:hypothetical protein